MNKRSMIIFAMMLVASSVFAQESAVTSAVPAVALSAPSLNGAALHDDQADTLFGHRRLDNVCVECRDDGDCGQGQVCDDGECERSQPD